MIFFVSAWKKNAHVLACNFLTTSSSSPSSVLAQKQSSSSTRACMQVRVGNNIFIPSKKKNVLNVHFSFKLEERLPSKQESNVV